MKRTIQSGFTLIELVMVIVILGILAATALPKYIDLQNDAKKAVVQGTVAALQSSAVMLYASYKTTSPMSTIKSNTDYDSNVTIPNTCSGSATYGTASVTYSVSTTLCTDG